MAGMDSVISEVTINPEVDYMDVGNKPLKAREIILSLLVKESSSTKLLDLASIPSHQHPALSVNLLDYQHTTS